MSVISYCTVLLFIGLQALAAPGTPWRSESQSSITPSPEINLEGCRQEVPFIANGGQQDSSVAYYTSTAHGTVFVTQTGRIVYSLVEGSTTHPQRRTVLAETVLGACGDGMRGMNQARTKVSIVGGRGGSAEVSPLPAFETLNFGHVYPGIELKLHACSRNVEKIFTVHPGSDPSRITVRIDGADELRVARNGQLEAVLSRGSVFFTAPMAYQETASEKTYVDVAYRVAGDSYGFEVGPYDHNMPLIIDPLLASTFLGGNDNDCGSSGMSMVFDTAGNLYVASTTPSIDFPTTTGVYDNTLDGGRDIVISLISPDLSTIIASTFLGGTGLDGNYPRGGPCLALSAEGNLYVAGVTFSSDFPHTSGAYDSVNHGGGDLFVTELSGDLTTVMASTLLGSPGYDEVNSMALDGSGHVYLAGYTRNGDFPIVEGAYQSEYAGTGTVPWGGDIVVCRLSDDLTSLQASTFLGGNDWDEGAYMVLGSDGSVFVSGTTNSGDFPHTTGAYQTSNHGGTYGGDGFISRFSADLSTLQTSTFLGGGENDWIYAIARDSSGHVLVAGHTGSATFPTTPGAYDSRYNSTLGADRGDDGFVSQLDVDLSVLAASTFIGTPGWENINTLSVGGAGDIFAGGNTNSSQWPTTPDTWDRDFNGGGFQYGGDAFFCCFDQNLVSLKASSYLGGSGQDLAKCFLVDTAGNLFLGGTTNSSDFPATVDAIDTSYNGGEIDEWGGDMFVTKVPVDYFLDVDGDGILNALDICPLNYDPEQLDSDNDLVGDACDNCPDLYNPDQADANENGIGDVCDGCCLPPTVGDVDQSGGVDITDISVLIDNQFLTLTPLVCEVEGDVDFSGGVDVTDVSILIDNQFLTLTPLPACP